MSPAKVSLSMKWIRPWPGSSDRPTGQAKRCGRFSTNWPSTKRFSAMHSSRSSRPRNVHSCRFTTRMHRNAGSQKKAIICYCTMTGNITPLRTPNGCRSTPVSNKRPTVRYAPCFITRITNRHSNITDLPPYIAGMKTYRPSLTKPTNGTSAGSTIRFNSRVLWCSTET